MASLMAPPLAFGEAGAADAHQPARPPDHHRHHQHAEQQHPVFGETAQQLRRHRQHEGRQHHAEGGAHAAQHHDRQDQRRLEEGERGRVDEALIGGEKYPRQPGGGGAQHKRRQLHQHVIEPERAAGYLILAQRLPGAADRHARQPVLDVQHQQHHQKQHRIDENELEVGVVIDAEKFVDRHPAVFGAAAELQAEHRRRRHRDAVRPAGERHPVVQHQPDDLAEPERNDGEIVAVHAQHRKAQQRAGQRRHQRPQRQHRPKTEPEILVAQRQSVGTDGVKRHVPQIEQPRQADHNVQPQAEQHVDQAEDRHRQQVFGGDEREQQRDRRHQRQDPAQVGFIAQRPHVNAVVATVEARQHPAPRRGLQEQAQQQPPGHHRDDNPH